MRYSLEEVELHLQVEFTPPYFLLVFNMRLLFPLFEVTPKVFRRRRFNLTEIKLLGS